MTHNPETYAAVERELREQLAEHSDAVMKLRPILMRMVALDCDDGHNASAMMELMCAARIDHSSREDDARDVATAEREVAAMLVTADADARERIECIDWVRECGTYFLDNGRRAV